MEGNKGSSNTVKHPVRDLDTWLQQAHNALDRMFFGSVRMRMNAD